MAGPRNRRHILVTTTPIAEKYRRHNQKRDSPVPYVPDSRQQHGQGLLASLLSAVNETEAARTRSTIQVQGAEPGFYLQFDSQPGHPLNLTAVAPAGAELLAVRYQTTSEESPRTIEQATVFIKSKSLKNLTSKLEKYANDEPRQPKEQRHESAFDPVSNLNLATLRSLWTDDDRTFPEPTQLIWWEVWLRKDAAGLELQRLLDFCAQARIRVTGRRLEFADRTVTLVQATANQLSQSLSVLSDLAEVRLAVVTADYFDGSKPSEQAEWVTSLLGQLDIPGESDVAVALLDTGVNRGHPLLEKSLDEKHCDSCDPNWGVHDHDGHGTEMAGICLFGDLSEQLGRTTVLTLSHRLESIKLLPPAGENEPELWGALTADASSRAELMGPLTKRTFCLATTSSLENHQGQPTLWSTSVDALASGMSFDSSNQGLVYLDAPSETLPRRLFVVSAGNIHPLKLESKHLDRSDLEPIQEPAQAWNALTVGAYTEKVSAPSGVQWKPLSARGDLSPWSTTSLTFKADWPIKPEILFEGGNAASDVYGITSCPDLSLLTTHHLPNDRSFTITWATSPATAQAARMSAQIMADNPALWPESVRGLMVHSARWTAAMLDQFGRAKKSKTQRLQLLRRYGYGVPSLEGALRSSNDSLTLIAQAQISPYRDGGLDQIHLHELPWPVEELVKLGETPVTLRITLSYFIEPNPGRKGWRERYSYQSHALRFDVKKATDTEDDFRKRMNALALQGEEKPKTSADKWFIGPKGRDRGSIHSDSLKATGADIAARNLIAVYPVSGWWKERPKRDRSQLGTPYSLIVSLETEATEVDLWTPVANAVNVPIEIAEL